MGSNHSHVNVPLVVRGRVTRLRQCPQTAALVCGERSAEAGNRTDVSSAYRQHNALPGSASLAYVRGLRVCPLKKRQRKKDFILFIYLLLLPGRTKPVMPTWVGWSVVSTSVTLSTRGLINCAYLSSSYPWQIRSVVPTSVTLTRGLINCAY